MITGNIKYLPSTVGDSKRKLKKSVKTTAIDTHIYQDSISDIEQVRDKLYSNNKKHEFVEQLTEDLFHCLYKVYPEINNEADIVEEQKFGHDILKNLIESENFSKLRNNTVANLFNSTLSLSSVQDHAMKIIDEYTSSNYDIKNMMDNISQAKSTREKIEKIKENGGDASALENKLQSLLKKISQSREDAQFDIGDMIDSFSKSIDKTIETVNDVNNLLDGFGGSEEAAIRKVPYDEKVKLAEAFKKSEKFKDVCDSLGRMTEMVNKVGKKPSPNGHSVCDIGVGNNLSRVLATEKIKLVDKELEDSFYKKFIDKNLLEFKTEGSEDGKGPMVICLDESGSMSGDRDTWAKSFCVACIQIAVKQKRDCKIIVFSSRVRREYLFEKKKFKPEDLVDFCTYFSNGGTDFERPLTRALETVKTSKFKKADILFITDGDPDEAVSEELLHDIKNIKATKGVRVQSVLIGSGVKDRYVRPFSDSIVRVSNLSEDSVMINVFDNIQN